MGFRDEGFRVALKLLMGFGDYSSIQETPRNSIGFFECTLLWH